MASFTAEHMDTLKAIVRHLPGWRLETRLNEVYDHTAEIIGPNKAMLNITQEKDKWKVYGSWPSIRGYHSFNVHTLERDHPYGAIRLDPRRNPKSIAADIKRRIMPQYLDGLAKVQAYIKQRAQKQESFNLVCHTVKTYLPVKQSNYQRQQGITQYYFTDCGINGDLQLYESGGAGLTLPDLTIEQIFSIVNLLKKEQATC